MYIQFVYANLKTNISYKLFQSRASSSNDEISIYA